MSDDGGGMPPQHQDRQPGIEAEMTPRPKDEARDYKAAGKFPDWAVLITGGDSGIGKSAAIHFAKEGADVAIAYLDEHQDAERTKSLIEAEGRRCLLIPGDLGEERHAREAVERTAREFGRLDVVILNASEQHVQTSLEDISEEQLTKTFRSNIFSAFFVAKAALKHLKEGASIIVTTSITAFRGSDKLIDYSSTKGAQLGFIRALSQSLVEKKIRVNGVAPGPVWTPLIPASFSEEDVAEFGKKSPMGRPGQPDEIAPSFIFLASPENSAMTGQVLHPNMGEIVA
jgi:NAD(P)-dependent dehydrogenase (short-subunit alcohol dehydrogenase family)